MIIGKRLRKIRDERGLSEGDIEHASGLLRCYISRVEHGRTLPSLDTPERFAAALDVPLYELFLSGDRLPTTTQLSPRHSLEELADEPGPSGSDARLLLNLREVISRMANPDKAFLLDFARRLAAR